MKKIMFNDTFGLTAAVLNGSKTMTRRVIPPIEVEWNRRGKVRLPILGFEHGVLLMDTSGILGSREKYSAPNKYQPKYEIGEIVAVAQSYRDIHEMMMADFGNSIFDAFRNAYVADSKGWNNKMFVLPELMPYKIKITGIKLERLWHISDEDCLKEGIRQITEAFTGELVYTYTNSEITYSYAKTAFACLFEKINGRGTWKKAPWCYAYTFELVKGGNQ